MSWLRFFRRRRADAELQEEIDVYLAEETAENIARGMKPEEARRSARIKLGNPRSVRETLWRQNTVSLVDTLARDLKYAVRTLARTPGFSLIAITVMALCIGATTSLFTVVRSVQVGQPSRPAMYFPVLSGNSGPGGLTLVLRTASDPLAMYVPVQKQIAALDPELPVSNIQTMQQAIGDSLGNASFSATLVLSFAVLSLVLASVGLYGVLSYLMTQRTTELGVRMALGAQRDQVLRLILFDGLRPAIIGLALGSAASAGITQLISSMLYDTKPLDPTVYVAVTFTLLMVATLACMIPAWRASRLDPMQALRAE